jgi:hypothetical protein
LLDVSVRIYDLFGLYGRKLLGHELQRGHLDLPRLWSHQRILGRYFHNWCCLRKEIITKAPRDKHTKKGDSVEDRPVRS